MKKLAFFFVFICGFAISSKAQLKKPVTATIATPTVQCGMCKKKIEDYMKREEGVTKVNVNFKQKYATVTYFPDRTNLENVKTAIANVGYDADDIKANEDSYKKLPTCCKKPEDQ
ncbi:MAG: cation transporter [Chitinophagaceae bacterium]|nr:cation transporter [Chitinophagaceae bacterium]MCW5928805.1 cation transporter [Chitinophagaceae bacterium]